MTVLLRIEMTVDTIPVVDTVNDVIQTVGRPLAGAILLAAASGVVGDLHPALAFLAGFLIAGGVHAIKAVARPVVTATTAGMGNWPAGLREDVRSLITAVLAIPVPILILLVIVAVLLILVTGRIPPG